MQKLAIYLLKTPKIIKSPKDRAYSLFQKNKKYSKNRGFIKTIKNIISGNTLIPDIFLYLCVDESKANFLFF